MLIAGTGILVRSLINPWRREQLGLGSTGDKWFLHGKPMLKLYAYSSHVVPVPPDWEPSTQVTGYWFLDSGAWQPPENLLRFLESGPAPVCVGFGSMAGTDTDRVTRTVLQAGKIAGQRLILATGRGGLVRSEITKEVCVLESAPHSWLFPRMAAVVHYGGAGTTAAGLRAGQPSVICPFFGDQHFWGKRVAALGAGPSIIPQRHLTAERLAKAITQAVCDTAIRERAFEIGERIRKEDGVGKAVELIEAYAC